MLSAPTAGGLWRVYLGRSSSRLTSGRRSTPRTTLKMAALAPIPSASVTTTVSDRPFARRSDRNATFRSVMKLMVDSLPANRKQCANAFVPQEQRSPDKEPDVDREQRMAEEGVPDSHMRRDCATEISGEQKRPEDGRLRNNEKNQAGELENSDPFRQAHRPSELHEGFCDGRNGDQLDDGVEQENQHRHGCQQPSSPSGRGRAGRPARWFSLQVVAVTAVGGRCDS